MEHLVPVEGHSGLYRDMKTGAIINTDSMEISSAKKKKLLRKQKKNDMEILQQEVKDLKNDLTEIKQMLANICNNQREE